MQKIQVASLDSRRYAETFAVFVAHSLEYPQMLKMLTSLTQERLHPGFRVLDVGAGTGMLIQQWIEHTGQQPGFYTAFEPNEIHIKDLADTISSLSLEHKIYPQPFTLEAPLTQNYDIVLFSHSLYWMPDPAEHMLYAASSLVKGGLVLAFIGGPYAVHAMFPLFEPYLERTSPMLQNNAMSSHELVQGLRAKGRQPKVQILPTPIDLTGLFETHVAVELAEIISFCMQIEFTTLPAWLQEDMIQYVQGGCVSQDGRLYWYLPTAVVMI